MAKKFFYVCGGIFLLTLSYHFGAARASAQIQNAVWECDMVGYCAATVVGRTITILDMDGRRGTLPPVPGSSEIVRITTTGLFQDGIAVLANGDVYFVRMGSPSWQLVGNLLSSATSARLGSWGALKAGTR